MDEFTPDLEGGFIVDHLRPPHQSHLGFLGDPLPAPFRGAPVEILRGNDRMFGPSTTVQSGIVDAMAPLAGDVSGMAGQMVGAEEHDPRHILPVAGGLEGQSLDGPGGDVDFADSVRQCWPRVMAAFMDMMQDPMEGGSHGGHES